MEIASENDPGSFEILPSGGAGAILRWLACFYGGRNAFVTNPAKNAGSRIRTVYILSGKATSTKHASLVSTRCMIGSSLKDTMGRHFRPSLLRMDIIVLVALLGVAFCNPYLPRHVIRMAKPLQHSTRDRSELPSAKGGWQGGMNSLNSIRDRSELPFAKGGRRGEINSFDETRKATLEKKREEVEKEVRNEVTKLVQSLRTTYEKMTAIMDDDSVTHKEKLKALRELRKENPKAYNVLNTMLEQVLPKKRAFAKRKFFGPSLWNKSTEKGFRSRKEKPKGKEKKWRKIYDKY